MDRISGQARSLLMSKIGSRNTKPELIIRKVLSELGFRYRLHAKEFPGRPDIVNRSRHIAIFAHGCFWHGHTCKRGRLPTSNTLFWKTKLTRNKQRDRSSVRALRKLGWQVLTIWECQTKDQLRLRRRIAKWLTDQNIPIREDSIECPPR